MTGTLGTMWLFIFLYNEILRSDGICVANRVMKSQGSPQGQGQRQGGLVSQQQGAQESWEAFLGRNGRLDRSVA